MNHNNKWKHSKTVTDNIWGLYVFDNDNQLNKSLLEDDIINTKGN